MIASFRSQTFLRLFLSHSVRCGTAGLLFAFLCVTAGPAHAFSPPRHYKIAVVHSYERGYRDAPRYRDLLAQALDAEGLSFEFNELYLNSNELFYDDELARASFFIDEWTRWGADAVVVFNNQAVYSLLKCGNPKLRDLPVVFAGVYCPEWELIRKYPNVTGFVDIPDYVRTVRMIERMFGQSRIAVMSGSGMMDGTIWRDLVTDCIAEGIRTYEGDVLEHILSHRSVRSAYDELEEVKYNERIDTTVVVRLMSEAMPLWLIQQTARGSETYLMYTSRTYNSMDAPEFFANPSFATINEGFGSNSNMLGGYFAPLETQMKEAAVSLAARLRGVMPSQQVAQSRKEYVLNWHVLRRRGISAEGLPAEYRIMYVPFAERYRMLIVAGSVFAGVALIVFIGVLLRTLSLERRRKRAAQRDLCYEHETLKLAIEGGMTYAWRRKGDLLIFDSHFYRLIGREAGPISLEQLLTFVHPEDRERLRGNFVHTDGASHRGEYRCNFSGEFQWWEFRYSYVKEDTSSFAITGLLQDIQPIKDREAELIEARRIAERAELKQSFLNNVSHEIRTPLNAIVGFSNMLVSSPDLSAEEKQEFIDLIRVNNDQLLNLIDGILELSRLESGSTPFVEQEVSLRRLLDSLYRTFQLQVKPTLEFRCDFPEEDIALCTDPHRLQQVVVNFLTNANKFTAEGHITLGYRLHPDGKAVRIFVEDTGRGIPSEEFEIIFSRFYKHDEFVSGTGLGLAICQNIVQRMGGRIEVESEVGKGSRFSVVLNLPETTPPEKS